MCSFLLCFTFPLLVHGFSAINKPAEPAPEKEFTSIFIFEGPESLCDKSDRRKLFLLECTFTLNVTCSDCYGKQTFVDITGAEDAIKKSIEYIYEKHRELCLPSFECIDFITAIFGTYF